MHDLRQFLHSNSRTNRKYRYHDLRFKTNCEEDNSFKSFNKLIIYIFSCYYGNILFANSQTLPNDLVPFTKVEVDLTKSFRVVKSTLYTFCRKWDRFAPLEINFTGLIHLQHTKLLLMVIAYALGNSNLHMLKRDFN